MSWSVTFSDALTGVTAIDLGLVGNATASIASVTSVGPTNAYTVTANVTAAGTLEINLVDDNSITTAVAPAGAGTGDGSFTGQVYNISPGT